MCILELIQCVCWICLFLYLFLNVDSISLKLFEEMCILLLNHFKRLTKDIFSEDLFGRKSFLTIKFVRREWTGSRIRTAYPRWRDRAVAGGICGR